MNYFFINRTNVPVIYCTTVVALFVSAQVERLCSINVDLLPNLFLDFDLHSLEFFKSAN